MPQRAFDNVVCDLVEQGTRITKGWIAEAGIKLMPPARCSLAHTRIGEALRMRRPASIVSRSFSAANVSRPQTNGASVLPPVLTARPATEFGQYHSVTPQQVDSALFRSRLARLHRSRQPVESDRIDCEAWDCVRGWRGEERRNAVGEGITPARGHHGQHGGSTAGTAWPSVASMSAHRHWQERRVMAYEFFRDQGGSKRALLLLSAIRNRA
jgi:hypothetical protein